MAAVILDGRRGERAVRGCARVHRARLLLQRAGVRAPRPRGCESWSDGRRTGDWEPAVSGRPARLPARLFDAAVAAASPGTSWPRPAGAAARTHRRGRRRQGRGRHGARRRAARGRGPLEGLVVTRYGHGVPCERIEVVEAAHPVPDARGREAAARILDLARGLGPDDLLICLVSGGGSALLALPAAGRLARGQAAVNTALLRCGRPIAEINCVRKHLSAVKGGRLAAAAHPARVVTYPHQRRARRRPVGGRLGADRARSDDLRRRPAACSTRYGIERAGAVVARLDDAERRAPAGARRRRPSRATRRSPATRSSCWRRPRDALGGGRGRGRGRRHRAARPRRRPGGRGTRPRRRHARLALACAAGGERRSPPCETAVGARRRPPGGAPGPAARAAARAALGRRDHGDRARPRPRRPQHRVPARPRARPRRRPRRLRARLRHRRHRRHRGQRRRRRRRPTRSSAPRGPVSTRSPRWPRTTPTASSRPSTISSSPGRRARTSTTSGPSSWRDQPRTKPSRL